MSQYLDTIVELQEALDQLAEAQERLHGIPDWMRELHDEHGAKSAEIQTLEEAGEILATERRAAEGAITDASVAKSLRDFLSENLNPAPETTKDTAKQRTSVRVNGDLMVKLLELEHR